MKKSKMEKEEIVEMFKGHSVLFLMTVHIIFTILLFVAMTHVQMQMSSHIALQERENKDLREMLTSYGYMSSRNGRTREEQNNDLEIKERNKPQQNTTKSKSKVRALQLAERQ